MLQYAFLNYDILVEFKRSDNLNLDDVVGELYIKKAIAISSWGNERQTNDKK